MAGIVYIFVLLLADAAKCGHTVSVINMRKIGLVLSGGGARGAAHLGVLQYLNEVGIPVSAVAGVSAGAVIAVMYAAGKTPAAILQLLKDQSYLGLKGLSFSTPGLFSMDGLSAILKKELPQRFDQLNIPVTVLATDIVANTPVALSSGEIATAVMASAAVPVIYRPVLIDGRQLADGGILNNLPASYLRDSCDIVIGSHVNKLDKHANIAAMPKMALIDRTFHMAIEAMVEREKLLCDVIVEPELYDFGMFQMKAADKMFDIGYNAARDKADEFAALLRIVG